MMLMVEAMKAKVGNPNKKTGFTETGRLRV